MTKLTFCVITLFLTLKQILVPYYIWNNELPDIALNLSNLILMGFFFFLNFQNKSAAENVIRHIKI